MASALRSLRILVADDYPGVAQSIADVISAAGAGRYVLDVALDGQEALDQATGMRPDVALLDLEMPRLGGLAAATAIRNAYRNCPPLLVAMTGSDRAFEGARQAAVFDHLMKKPIELFRLFDVLHSLEEQR
jgi:CheY-like chemotaxis protein